MPGTVPVSGSLYVKDEGPQFKTQCRPDGSFFNTVQEAHDTWPYRGPGHERFIDDGKGGYIPYIYIRNTQEGNKNLASLVLKSSLEGSAAQTYLPPFEGSGARSVSSRLAESLFIEDFRKDENNVDRDDNTTFEKALAASQSLRMPIEMGSQPYRWTKQPIISGDYFKIYGNKRTTIENQIPGGQYINSTVAPNFELPSYTDAGVLTGSAFYFTSLIYYSEIRDININNFRFGISFMEVHNTPMITGVNFNNCNLGIMSYQGTQNIQIYNCGGYQGCVFSGASTCLCRYNAVRVVNSNTSLTYQKHESIGLINELVVGVFANKQGADEWATGVVVDKPIIGGLVINGNTLKYVEGNTATSTIIQGVEANSYSYFRIRRVGNVGYYEASLDGINYTTLLTRNSLFSGSTTGFGVIGSFFAHRDNYFLDQFTIGNVLQYNSFNLNRNPFFDKFYQDSIFRPDTASFPSIETNGYLYPAFGTVNGVEHIRIARPTDGTTDYKNHPYWNITDRVVNAPLRGGGRPNFSADFDKLDLRGGGSRGIAFIGSESFQLNIHGNVSPEGFDPWETGSYFVLSSVYNGFISTPFPLGGDRNLFTFSGLGAGGSWDRLTVTNDWISGDVFVDSIARDSKFSIVGTIQEAFGNGNFTFQIKDKRYNGSALQTVVIDALNKPFKLHVGNAIKQTFISNGSSYTDYRNGPNDPFALSIHDTGIPAVWNNATAVLTFDSLPVINTFQSDSIYLTTTDGTQARVSVTKDGNGNLQLSVSQANT